MSVDNMKGLIILANYQNSASELAQYFADHYFGQTDSTETWWVADEIGGVFAINDYFFNVGDMFEFLYFGYPAKKMFEYYEYALECADKEEIPINIKAYRKLIIKKHENSKKSKKRSR